MLHLHIFGIPQLLSRGLAPTRQRSHNVTVITVSHSRKTKQKEMTSTVSYKVILLGERGVGKTKLFKALREMETEVNTEGESCTDHTSSGAFDREPSRSMISTVESQIDTCTKDVEIGGGGQVVRVSK